MRSTITGNGPQHMRQESLRTLKTQACSVQAPRQRLGGRVGSVSDSSQLSVARFVWDVLHARIFEARILCSLFANFFLKKKKTSKCCDTTIQPKWAWSRTNHGHSTPTRSGIENHFSRQKRSAMDTVFRTY